MAVVTCLECGAKNRVDENKAQTRQPVCGRCGARLMAENGDDRGVIDVSDATFDQVIATPGKPVLVDCWAPWCGPCRMIGPVIEQLAADSRGRYIVGKLNVDENPEVAARYRVESIPMLLIFKDGRLVDHVAGVQPKDAIARRLASMA